MPKFPEINCARVKANRMADLADQDLADTLAANQPNSATLNYSIQCEVVEEDEECNAAGILSVKVEDGVFRGASSMCYGRCLRPQEN